MEISLIYDTVTTTAAAAAAATQGLGFAKFVQQNFVSNNHLSLSDSSSDPPSTAGILQISAMIFPIDAIAPPPVKPNYLKAVPRLMVRKTRRTRRRSSTDGGDEDGFFYDGTGGGGGMDDPFGGGGGGGGWSYFSFGGFDWDESSSYSYSDPAFDVVYEVLCWIVLSNCLHFAFKKVVRFITDGVDSGRGKVPMRLTPVC